MKDEAERGGVLNQYAMQNNAIFYFHFDIFIFENKAAGGKIQLDRQCPGLYRTSLNLTVLV
jgi:hypothetical protein